MYQIMHNDEGNNNQNGQKKKSHILDLKKLKKKSPCARLIQEDG
jgi:hypothetical protein